VSDALRSARDDRSEPTSRRAIRRWIAGAAIVLAVGLAALALRPSSAAPVPAARVTRRDLVVPILADGNLEPAADGERRAVETATVGAILVKEGTRVTRDTPLVRLENPELSESALQARSAALELVQERTRAAAEVDQQKREANHRRELVESDKRLLEASAIARSAYEADELAYRQALDALRSAEARLESLDGGGRGSRNSRLALAEASARELENRVAALLVRASADGIVFGLPRKVGETVQAGQIVASVAEPEHLRVRARIDQPDLPRIAVGQRFLVTFDGLPDRRWEGRVTEVSAGVREAGGREVGEVLGEISDPALSLPPNASVNVQIVVGERRAALVIPRAALFRDGERRFVYRLERGRARRRDVSVGLIGLNDIEVTGGLAEKDTVLLSGSSPLSDGLRVTVKEGG
jgi:multidrug efflux pump subunit AcrA (membrane-fusion protein)